MDRQLLVFAGSSNQPFARSVCRELGIGLGNMELVRFSDGELSVEIGDNVRGRDVFVLQSTSTPGNDNLIELCVAIDALKRASAWRITAVIPYFGYARQDRKMRPRVPITAKLVANILTTAGADRILTMDLHSGQIMGFFDCPVDNLNALPVFLPYLDRKYGKDNLSIVSPDMGGVERARLLAQRLGNADIAVIDKRRSGPNQVSEMKVVGQVKDKTCIIVDDMVDTAGTLVKAAETLLHEGATHVLACCVHPVLSGPAFDRLIASPLGEVIVSDSIYQPRVADVAKVSVLSVAPIFAEAIRRIHGEDSVSSLFR